MWKLRERDYRHKHSQIIRDGKFVGSVVAGFRLHYKRRGVTIVEPLTGTAMERMLALRCAIPMGDISLSPIRTRVQAPYDRRMIAPSYDRATIEPTGVFSTGSNSDWSKKSTFNRHFSVQSYGIVFPARLRYVLDGVTSHVVAPRGWRWNRDENGIRLVSVSDPRADYHPTSDDLTGPRPGQTCAAKARENLKKRIATAKQTARDLALLKRAEKFGISVCLADSIRAGNCRAGTIRFCENHKIAWQGHVAPSAVLAVANGNTRFVALAVLSAQRRAGREIEQGFCSLADHRA